MKLRRPLQITGLVGILAIIALFLRKQISRDCPDMEGVKAEYVDNTLKDKVRFSWTEPNNSTGKYKIKILEISNDSTLLVDTTINNLFYIQSLDNLPEDFKIEAEVSVICTQRKITLPGNQGLIFEDFTYYGKSQTVPFPPSDIASVAIVFPIVKGKTGKKRVKEACDCTEKKPDKIRFDDKKAICGMNDVNIDTYYTKKDFCDCKDKCDDKDTTGKFKACLDSISDEKKEPKENYNGEEKCNEKEPRQNTMNTDKK